MDPLQAIIYIWTTVSNAGHHPLVGNVMGESLVDLDLNTSFHLVGFRPTAGRNPLSLGEVFADSLIT